jgi:hypothetical protein
MIKKLKDVKESLNILYTDGIEMGKSVGWNWDVFPYTVKLGSTTYIAGAPASGKSEFWFEILINLSCLHGWKHVIYSPETGSHVDIYTELMHKFMGKPYVKSKWAMDERERLIAETFIDKHFFVFDDQSDMTPTDFYKMVDEFETENEITIHTTTVDPWNELKYDFLPEDLGREDFYLSRVLGEIRKKAKAGNKHHCIITHVRDQKMEKNKDGAYYYPFPTARDLAGGQTWFRKGMSVILFQRYAEGFMIDGVPTEHNEVHVKVAKTKPKGTSKNGIYKFFLNLKAYRYYTKDIAGREIYADRANYDTTPRLDVQVLPKMLPANEMFDFDNSKINDTPF